MTRTSGLPAREFSFLWAAAILFQYISQLSFTLAITLEPFTLNAAVQAALVLSAAVLIFFPGSVVTLLCVAALQVAHVGIMLPDIPNHRLFSGMVNASILLTALSLLLSRKPVTLDSVWERAAPQVQALVVLLYFFAAIAKINSAYLDTSVSCAKVFLDEINAAMPFQFAAIYFAKLTTIGSLVVELSLAFLLTFAATRSFAVLLAFGFHFVLALDTTRHFLDFSSVMMATVAAFSPRSIFKLLDTRAVAIVVASGAILCITLGHFYPDLAMYRSFLFVRDATWMIYATTVLIFAVNAIANKPEEAPARIKTYNSLSPLLLATPLLAILNGLTPYVGIKTKSSWDMYSNVRLEGDAPNHFFFGGGLDLFDQLRFPVHILSSSNNYLRENFINADYDITPFELRDVIAHDPGGVTTFHWKGETFRDYFHRDGTLILSRPVPWLMRKLMWFRPIDRQTPARCQR